MIKPITIHVPDKVRQRIRRAAVRHFPIEMFAALLGTIHGNLIDIQSIWIPPDLCDYALPSKVSVPDHWAHEAHHAAEDEGLSVVGSIHSHPSQEKGELCEPAPSKGDYEDSAWSNICGIITVARGSDDRLNTWMHFYGPVTPVKLLRKLK